jgi:hypothetical protein
MGIARVIGISPFLVALVVHSANAEDFGADLRKADVTDQRIYQAATNGGSPSAMYALGVMRNLVRAKDLYLRSAAQGYPPAMVNLGLLYIEAMGVRRDDVRGYALVAAAVAIGIPDEMTRLASAEINEASERLDARRMAEAQLRARRLVADVSSGDHL